MFASLERVHPPEGRGRRAAEDDALTAHTQLRAPPAQASPRAARTARGASKRLLRDPVARMQVTREIRATRDLGGALGRTSIWDVKVELRSAAPAAPARPARCPRGTWPSSDTSTATVPAVGVARAPDGRRAQQLPRRPRQRVSRVMDAVGRHVPAVGRHTSATRALHSPRIQKCSARASQVSRPSAGTWRATPARGGANVKRRPAGEGRAARGRRAHL